MRKLPSWIHKYVLDCSIQPTDSAAKIRAIRISNVITLSAILNTLVFTGIFYFSNSRLFGLGLYVALIYTTTHLTSIFVNSLLGRALTIFSGYVIVFYFSCLFRGEAGIQLFLFSLGTSTFMHFCWEEKHFFKLAVIPTFLYLLGEYSHWSFFEPYTIDFDLRLVRVFSVFATMFQVLFSMYYFLKQSVRFESERVAAFAQLELEHQKQLQVQKMSSLGEMAAGISHEINNPLMVIMGSTFYLKKEISPNEPSYKRIEKIDQMISRISRIIHALRNFSRNSEKDLMELVSLTSIVESTLDLCKERFVNANVELIVEVPDVNVFCRPTEISQVIINLLNNSFDACSSLPEAKVFIKAREVNDKIEILIEDTGAGIKPENESKLMQPFFTTKEVGKGTGLGLSISRGLIEAHNGTLSYVKDRPRTTFQILLPVVEAGISIT